MSEILFKVDTKHRKQWFTGMSFSHPAKMSLPLQLWIIENYTKVGETILDPMAGSGTLMVCCSLGRNCILVELEDKFCSMMQANWEKVKQRGSQMGYSIGTCQIIQGDARNLTDLIGKPASEGDNQLVSDRGGRECREASTWQVSAIITSPPYAETIGRDAKYYKQLDTDNKKRAREMYGKQDPSYSSSPDNIGNLPYGEIDKCIFSPPFSQAQQYSSTYDEDFWKIQAKRGIYPTAPSMKGAGTFRDNPNNISNLPYGNIDSIITSPPYGNPRDTSEEYDDKYDLRRPKGVAWGRESFRGRYGEKEGQIGKLEYGEIDSIITSPPYEKADPTHFKSGSQTSKGRNFKGKRDETILGEGYSQSPDNIGNLKSQSYLEAMLQVYQQCYKVLKPQGLMILVTKNFIRNKAIVRLDEDTIKLCEQTGFQFVERHYRKLPTQSFWRVIYKQKYPDAPVLDKEDILVFKKKIL